jgi:serine/threonine-protein kinase
LLVGLDVCRGLDYAHKRNLVHGAISPGNLLFGLDQRVRIADFGLARLLAAVAWADPSKLAVDVARYASPEQALGGPVEPKSDVYSLCLTLVESVTGRVPFTADTTVATLSARVDKLMPVSADLGALASVLERAGRPRPADRATAAEFGRGLVQAAEKMPRPAPIPIVGMGLFGDVTGSLPRLADTTGPTERIDLTGALARASGLAAAEPAGTAEQEPDASPEAEPEPLAGPGGGELQPTDEQEPAVETLEPGGPSASTDVAPDTAPDVAPVRQRVTEPTMPPPVEPPVRPAAAAATVDLPTEAITTVLPPPVPAAAAPPAPPAPPVGAPVHSPLPTVPPPIEPPPLPPPALTEQLTEQELADSPAELTGDTDDQDLDPSTPPDTATADRSDGLEPSADGELVTEPESVDPGLAAVDPTRALANGPDTEVIAPEVRRFGTSVERVQGDDDAPTFTRRGVLAYVIVALGLLLAAVIGVLGYRALRTPSYEVPNLIGTPEAEAMNQVAGNGWTVTVDRVRDDSQPQGDVIRTQPAAGEKLKRGSSFSMLVSDGPTLAVLPEIINTSLSDARVQLEALGLSVRQTGSRADEAVPAGFILSWLVPEQPGIVAGGEVPKGTAIEVVVSDGPAPRSVPNVVGLSTTDAATRLAERGLVPGTTTEEFSDTVGAGVILSSEPAAGTQVPKGTAVNVVVSKGADQVVVPDLIGKTKAEVDALLAQAGLVLGSVSGPLDGVVAGSDFAAGSRVDRGTAISVVFGTR